MGNGREDGKNCGVPCCSHILLWTKTVFIRNSGRYLISVLGRDDEGKVDLIFGSMI